MTSRLRRLALTAHVAVSVGWLGAVAAVLALAIAGVSSNDPDTVRAVYVAMEVIAWFALVPLAAATLVTGLIESLTTKWGLVRHYWVITKLLITVVATIVLVLYTETLDYFADVAVLTTGAGRDFGVLRSPSAVLHAGVALCLLTTATALALFKPPGMTRFGRRRERARRTPV